MKILKIVETARGEIAYLFDGERVMKVFVEDLTSTKTPRRETTPRYEENFEEEEQELEEVAPVVVPRRVKVTKSPQVKIELDADGLPNLPRGEQPKPSIIPLGMRGMFIEHDQPGAAVERRKV